MEPGDVVWVELSPVQGREQSGRRPCVVVSSRDHLAAAQTLVTIVPGTSRDRAWPNHIALTGPTGLDTATFAMTEQARTVARGRVVGVAGAVDDECLDQVSQWLHRWLA